MYKRGGVTESISVSRARADLGNLVNRVAYRGERILITRHDREVAVLVPVDDLRLLREASARHRDPLAPEGEVSGAD